MPKVRQATSASLNMPGLILGCVLVGLVVLGFFQQQFQKRKRRTQYHPPLQLQQSSTGVLNHIGKRKEDLLRYIDNLKEQLAAREDQLRYHDELEEIVTSRVDTDRRDEEDWASLMRAGKKMYGDTWNLMNEEECSLRELMELHKKELLEYKRLLHNQPKSDPKDKKQNLVQPPFQTNPLLPTMQPVAPLPDAKLTKKSLPSQWRSTRAKAGSRLSPAVSTQLKVLNVEADVSAPAQKIQVPALDFSRLTSKPTVGILSIDAPDESAQKKEQGNFKATFQRQTRLAAMLRKKK